MPGSLHGGSVMGDFPLTTTAQVSDTSGVCSLMISSYYAAVAMARPMIRWRIVLSTPPQQHIRMSVEHGAGCLPNYATSAHARGKLTSAARSWLHGADLSG